MRARHVIGEGALLAFVARWRAARRAALSIRIQRTVSKGLSAIE